MNDIVKQQIPVSDLEIGMYVVDLDRPWLETNFLMQGFLIQSQQEIHELQRQCEFVFIEGHVQEKQTKQAPTKRKGLFSKKSDSADIEQKKKQAPPSQDKKVTYINKVSFEKEFDSARDSYKTAKSVASSIMDGIRIGRAIDMNQARDTVNEIVDSILRNSNALAWLSKVRDKDEYTAEHALNVCILSVMFARHLGHDEEEIRKIGLCGLLHDVGKAKVPIEILNKPGRFTNEEFEIMKQHPTFGRSLLVSLPEADRAAVDVAYCHHEREDSNGYPRGLKSHQIPYFAKLVSLADTYDAITSSRCYDKGRASMDALDIIYQSKGKQFDAELAIEFIKCIGIYPPGSIVELTNEEVGIVIVSNEKIKLRPKIMLVKDADKNWCREKVIDLSLDTKDKHGKIYMIGKEVPNGTHGVDIREYIKKGLVLTR